MLIKCGDCHYMVRESSNAKQEATLQANNNLGECRRYPKASDDRFPLVHKKLDWCGEYKEKQYEPPAPEGRAIDLQEGPDHD